MLSSVGAFCIIRDMEKLTAEVILGIGGLIVGLVGIGVAAFAVFDLRHEAAKLRNLLKLIIASLEESGLGEFTRDASGEISGLTLHITTPPAIHSTRMFSPSVSQDPPENR
jgi:hypothetical protein